MNLSFFCTLDVDNLFLYIYLFVYEEKRIRLSLNKNFLITNRCPTNGFFRFH